MAGLILSCGVLIVNPQRELLLCHATGTPRWDIPKGVGEAGETEVQTAVREVIEETGIELVAADLLELGRFSYLRSKDLHLQAALLERVDARRCVCRTHYRDARGRDRPEMDAHAWVGFDAVPMRCGKSLAALLTGRLSLPVVLDDLLEREKQSGPMRWRWAAG
jgi:8-oxo-dGTP pyrophosphatase MutT (NUDIX family)